MERHGFINDMMDVKILILFVTERVLYPLSTQQLYELCLQDDKLSYFDLLQALPEMVQTGHLAQNKEGYVITDKGRETSKLTCDSLALPVRQRAARAIERFNREVRRDSFIRTEVIEQPGGEALAVMHLDDELGSLMTIELTATSARQAAFLTRAFHRKADKLFQHITLELTAREPEEQGEA